MTENPVNVAPALGVRTIHIHAEAPRKPAFGEPCNGCGVCCLVEPCPLGVVISRRRTGACDALRWTPDGAHYRCGALTGEVPGWSGRLPALLQSRWKALAGRWISAGRGCDCSLDASEAAGAAAVDASADQAASRRSTR
jgi:hypothetical protein